MKLIIAAAAAHYTEHDEIVGLQVSVEGSRPAAAVQVGAIAPTGLLTVATPCEVSHRITPRMIEESCTACSVIILKRYFPSIAITHRLNGPARIRRNCLEYDLVAIARRTIMG